MSEHTFLMQLGFATTNLGFMLHHDAMMYRVVFGVTALLYCLFAIKTMQQDKENYNNE